MSWQAVRAVLLYSNAKSNERLVMVVIADFVIGDSYESYPSIETIAKRAKIHKSTIHRRILPKLIEMGELAYESGAKKNQTNIYKILLPKYEHNAKSSKENSDLSSRKSEDEMSHFEYKDVANSQDSSRNSATQTIIKNEIEQDDNDDFSWYACSKCNSLAKSYYTHEQCLAFAEYSKSKDSSIRSPAALATWMHRNGAYDSQIEQWLHQNPPPRTKSVRELYEEEKRRREIQQSENS